MANYQNHVIDPTFFYDCIEQFAFDYDAYIVKNREADEYGRLKYQFDKVVIRGSLQSKGLSIRQDMKGNMQEMKYEFYCKSLYRIKDGDFIRYKDKWLHVDEVFDYDEYGVRQVNLTMVQLAAYKDLEEYVRYIEGRQFV